MATIDPTTRTYTGNPPASAVTTTQRSTGVDLSSRTVLPGAQPISRRAAQDAAAVQMQIAAQQRQQNAVSNPSVSDSTYFYNNPTANPNYIPYTPTEQEISPPPGSSWEDWNPPSTAPQYIQDNSFNQKMKAARDRLAALQGDVANDPTRSVEATSLLNSQRASERAALTQELNALEEMENRRNASNPMAIPKLNQPISQTGGSTRIKQAQRNAQSPGVPMSNGRQEAVQGLMSQGVTDPNQAVNFLNYDEAGNRISDYSVEEVQGYMGGSQAPGTFGSRTAPTAPGVSQSPQTPGQAAQSSAINLGLIGLPPEIVQAFEPTLQAAQNSKIREGSILDAQLGAIQEDRRTADMVFEQGSAAALESRERQLKLEAANDQLSRDSLYQIQRSKLATIADLQRLESIDASRQEQLQRQTNLEQERQDRIYLAKTGQVNSTAGIDWAQRHIQQGTDALNYIISRASASSALRANQRLDVLDTYSLDLRKADAQHLQQVDMIFDTYNTTLKTLGKDRLMEGKTQREARDKAYLDYNNSLDKADEKWGSAIEKAYLKVYDREFEIQKQENIDKRADERMTFQEKMADKRLAIQMNRDDARADRQMLTDEKKEAKEVRAQFNQVASRPSVKEYNTIRDATNKAKADLDRALALGTPEALGEAKETITVLRAKGLDPTSVVREGEFERAKKSQSWMTRVKNVWNAAEGGDMTGISKDMITDFIDAMSIMTQTQRDSALAEYTPAINFLSGFNTRSDYINLDPREIVPPEFIDADILQSYEVDNNYNYDYGSESGYQTGTDPDDPEVTDPIVNSMPSTGMTMDRIMSNFNGLQLLSSPESQTVQQSEGTVGETLSMLGTITQDYNTAISSKNYAQSTANAWGGTHQGIDVAMKEGSFVPSLTDATIKAVEFDPKGWGLSVVLQTDDGAEFRYSHLASVDPLLQIGDRLVKGREFAQVGHTGNVFSTSGGRGTHLDLRIKKDGKYVDPFTYS